MRYVCQICGYVYDEAKEKTPFEQLPETWKCPLCGASKSDFRKEEAQAGRIGSAAAVEETAELKELSAGQMSALCSNLARGCEKRYRDEEAGLFRQLADYFSSHAPAVGDATVEKLYEELTRDIEIYPAIRAIADESHDRGAARICVWGEKVTRMLGSLVGRYIKEGEKMLEGASIWLCTTCGFVYVGEKAPEICPVCKVPAWKFEKVERRA